MTAPRYLLPALSITSIVSWGSLYYAFALLARPIQTELGWSAELTVGAYSLALLVTGLSAYPVGKSIDRHGGRTLMTLGSVLASVFFFALSQTTSLYGFYGIWAGLGLAMALTLYEPAFAVIVHAYPHGYRKRIGLLTLAGGFASTVFWPLTHALVSAIGWRSAALALGAANLLICAPLHWLAVPRGSPKQHLTLPPESEIPKPLSPGRHPLLHRASFWLLGLSFTAFGIVTAAMAVHVIPMLESQGLSAAATVSLAALIGPMQVGARLIEVIGAARLHVLVLGAVTVLLIPLALLLLIFASAALSWVYAFVMLYGAGVGLSTIVKAATPAELFGRSRYASVSGALATPTILARAVGPFAATAVLTTFTQYSAVLALLLGVSCAGALSYWLAISTRK